MAAAAAVMGSLTDVRKLSLATLPERKNTPFSELLNAIDATKGKEALQPRLAKKAEKVLKIN